MKNLYKVDHGHVTLVLDWADYSESNQSEDVRENPVCVLAETAEEALCAALQASHGYLQADNDVFDGREIVALKFRTDREPRYRYLLHAENGKTYWIHAPWGFIEIWNEGHLSKTSNAFVFEYSDDLESCELVGNLFDVLEDDRVFEGWIDESCVINLLDREVLTQDEIVLFEALKIVEMAKPEALERVKDVIFRAARSLDAPHRAARTITEQRSKAARENGKKGGRPKKTPITLPNL